MRKPVLIASLMLFAALVSSQLTARHLERRHAAQLEERQQQWGLDQRGLHDRLEAALAAARLQPPTLPAVSEVRATADREPRAEELLATLAATPSLAGLDETSRSRRIIYLLEKLVEAGAAAVPAIQRFLSQQTDVDLPGGGTRGLVPGTLRLALIDVLRRIGGAEAVAVLAETLQKTAIVRELIAAADALNQVAPGQYRLASLAAARELLKAASLEPRGRETLYAFLAQTGDTSLAEQARSELIGADGRLDRGALQYLDSTLGEQAIEILAAAVKDSRVTDPGEKRSLIASISRWVGYNARAAELFVGYLQDESIPYNIRFWTVGQLNNVNLNRDHPSQQDLAAIGQRQTLIQSLLPAVAEEGLSKELIRMHQDLDRLLGKDASAR